METNSSQAEGPENEATQDSESIASQSTFLYSFPSEPVFSQNGEMENNGNRANSLLVNNSPLKPSKSGNALKMDDNGKEHNQNPDVNIFEQALGNMQDDINFKESTDSENDSQPPPSQSYTDSQLAFLHSLGISVCIKHFANFLGRFRGLLEH